ncbi:unnamed protein product [Symbiodinium sp. CCMP2592]|nr:unnamed protein product [Symbiodinium sp. CCMP2592]
MSPGSSWWAVATIAWLRGGDACTDLIPGWQDKDGRDCNHYRNTKKWCTPTGAYDHEWDPEFRFFFADYLLPNETLTAADVCCNCGAGLCKDEKHWVDSRGWSCDQYYQEGWCPSGLPAGENLQAYAVDNVSAAEACCQCGGGCQSSSTWVDSGGNNCSAYYHQQWCAWSGGVGPGWDSSWGAIEAYAVGGQSAWDACCECSRCKDDVILNDQDEVAAWTAQGCRVARKLRLQNEVSDSSVFSHVRNIYILEVIQSQVTSLAGFGNAIVGDMRILGNFQLASLEGIGGAYDTLMNFMVANMPLVTSLHGLPAFRRVYRLWRILAMPALVDIAAMGTLEEVGWMDGLENPAMKSFHGLERLHTIRTRNFLQRSVRFTQMGDLESLDAFGGLRGAIAGTVEMEFTPTANGRISAQGFLGFTTACASFCFLKGISLRATPAPLEDSYCFPDEDRLALSFKGGISFAGGPQLDPASFGSGCTRCAEDCGHLSHGYRVACDYRVGLCGCPLGTMSTNCNTSAPEVRIVPGQSQECTRPRKADGETIACEVCIAVYTSEYNSSAMDPPRTLRVEEAQSALRWAWPQQISWQSPFNGTLCTNISLSAMDPPLGDENLELVLAYSDYAQDFFLPGSLRNPLRNPIEPIYPWCLDTGDCTRTGTDPVSFSLTISEPPVGRAEFSHQEIYVREGTVGAVVVKRVGGDYGRLTTTIEVDNSSAAVQDFNYLWPGFTLSWLHGDSRSKAIAVVFKDNSVAEPDVVLSVRLPQGGENSTCNVWIQDDGDAGQLGFSDQRRVVPETSLSDGCLFHARRDGGSSGLARVRVEVAECLTQESPAVEGQDFLFAPGVLTWADGEIGEKCAVFAPSTSLTDAGVVQGAALISVLEDASTERDEAVCFGLTLLEGVAEVATTEGQGLSPSASLVLLDQGVDGGPQQAPCARGRPCYVDLSNSLLARQLAGADAARRLAGAAVGVFLSLGICPACDAPAAAERSELNDTYVASFPQLAVDPGQYLVCLCAGHDSTAGKAVASLTVDGIQGGHQATCALGQKCQLPVLQGLGLQAGDALTVQELCGQTELLDGLPSQVATDDWGNGSYVFASDAVLQSSQGLFNLCWCRPQPNLAQPCIAVADFAVQVGLFKVEGPRFGQAFECQVDSPNCALSGLAGTGLRAGDKIMAKETCESADAVDWGAAYSVAVTADGRNYSFGALRGTGTVLQELALCWCPSSAPCSSPGDYRGDLGRLSLRCPEGYYWPTAEGVSLREGECQPCEVYQKTAGSGSIGRAACLCRTLADGWPFQEVTDGNCGCRDGYVWDGDLLGCVPCNEGQDCRWENLFRRSLEPPPLIPGHWSDDKGSVYRCFSTSTCPFTNSTCAVGRTGKACAVCEEGFIGGHDGECQPFKVSCAQESTEASVAQFMAILIPIAVLLIALGMVWLARRHQQVADEQNKHVLQTLSGLREALAQNFQYLQILSIVSLFKVRWPPLLSEIWAFVRGITAELITIPSLGCVLPHPSSFNEMLVRYLIPVLLAAMTLLSWLLVRLARKGLRACGGPKAIVASLDVRGIQMLELLVLTGCLFYSLIVRNGFIVFTCSTGPNGISSVVIYPHIDCPSSGADLSDWMQLLPFALVYNLVFSLGFTFLVFHAARKVAEHLVKSNFHDRGPWHFVATEFRDTYIWWLFLKMMKDLQINILAAVFTNLGSIQLLSTAVVSTLYGYLCAHHHPFRDPMNNLLEVWCSLSVAGICFFASGMGFAYDAEDDYAETALETQELGEDGSLRAQILLGFQLISFAGGFGILFLQLFGVAPGVARWIPQSMRPRDSDGLELAAEQLGLAFKAADFSKFDDVAVARNFALLQESRALLQSTKWHIRRSGSFTRLMPGRHYMARLISKEKSMSMQLEDDGEPELDPRGLADTGEEVDASRESEDKLEDDRGGHQLSIPQDGSAQSADPGSEQGEYETYVF